MLPPMVLPLPALGFHFVALGSIIATLCFPLAQRWWRKQKERKGSRSQRVTRTVLSYSKEENPRAPAARGEFFSLN